MLEIIAFVIVLALVAALRIAVSWWLYTLEGRDDV